MHYNYFVDKSTIFLESEVKMTNINVLDKENSNIVNNNVENMIYEIRGVQVMLS